MTIALEILARIRGDLTTSGDGGVAALPVLQSKFINLADGTGADQANAIYIDDFSIAASGSQNYDLAGALTDRLGNLLVFTAVKAIYLVADAANTNNIILGNGATPFIGPFGAAVHTLTVGPGGVLLLAERTAAGWPVVAGTGDILKLANSGAGTAVVGTLVVVGKI